MFQSTYQPNPALDLILERIVEIPPDAIWRAWTQSDLLKKWFTPSPWVTVDCEINLCAGGLFRTTMRSPEGQDFANAGCYLEVIEHKKLVWTNSLTAGFRPAMIGPDEFYFTAAISLEAHPQGTKYTAIVTHGDEESCKKHNDLGFHDGWGAALDQLVALIKKQQA